MNLNFFIIIIAHLSQIFIAKINRKLFTLKIVNSLSGETMIIRYLLVLIYKKWDIRLKKKKIIIIVKLIFLIK